MNIATALNKKYIRYTIVMLLSLCINNKNHVNAYLLHSELSDDDINYIRKNLSRYDITIIPIKVNGSVFDSRFPRTLQWSLETYYRLFLLDELPPDVEKLLYLDVDLIINKDISEFYNMDFGTSEIIACEDSMGKIPWDARTDKQRSMFLPMIEKGYKYFNAGVMLMNISLLRQNYNFDKYLDYIKQWNYEMSAPDQDILNYVHWKNVNYIDAYKYDLFARSAHNENITYNDVKNNTAIIHYAGEKPWESKNVPYDIEMLWWDYARQTDFYYEMLEEFISQVFTNTIIEEQINGLSNEINSYITALDKAVELNKKLLAMTDNGA